MRFSLISLFQDSDSQQYQSRHSVRDGIYSHSDDSYRDGSTVVCTKGKFPFDTPKML